MVARRAQSVSVDKLLGSIDKAVRIAARRPQVVVEDETFLDRWEIIGRQVRRAADLNDVYRFAEDVTRSARLRGSRAQPAVAKIGRDILCGYIERGGLPRIIGR